MKRFLVIRPNNDNVEVLIIKNKNDNTYSYVNLTKGHICTCRFKTMDEAIFDMDELKEQGKIVDYKQIL